MSKNFRWKDRSGAIRQACYEFRQSRARVQEIITSMTQDDRERERRFFGSGWVPRLNVEGTLQDVCELVLGTGTRYQDYYCQNPESMTSRQYTQFREDVRNAIRDWDSVTERLQTIKTVK